MLSVRNLLPVVTQRPFTSFVTALCAALVCMAGLLQLKTNNDYKSFFSADDPWLIASETIQDTYTRDQNIMMVVHQDNGDLFNAHSFECVLQATELGWTLPYVTRVDSISNFQHSEALGDDLNIRDLIEADQAHTDEYISSTKQAALNEPQIVNRLISPDGKTTGINLTLHFNAESEAEMAEAAEATRQWKQQLNEACPNTTRKLTGVVMVNDAIAKSSKHDMLVLGPAMFCMIVVVMGWLFRSISAVIGSVMVMGLSIGAALGIAGWIGYEMTPTLAIAPTMMLTMAVADCIHLLSGVRDALVRQRLKGAVLTSLKLNALPIAITSLTTAIGFLGMRVADNPPLVQLGTVAAIGITAAMFLSLTLLPAWLLMTNASLTPQPRSNAQWMLGIASWVAKQRRPIILITTILTLAMAWSATRNQATEDLTRYFKTSTDIRQAMDYSLEKLTGFYQIQFSLDTAESNGIAEPEYLQALDEFSKWFYQQEGVLHVASVADIVKRLNQNMNGDQLDWYRVPESRNLSAQYLFMYQMSLPFGLTLENLVTADFNASRLVVTLGKVESEQIRELENRAYEWLQTNAPELATIEGRENRGAGPAMMYAHTASKITSTMTKATFFALIGISFLLCFALRSLGWGLLSMIPNVIPAMIAFGLWGWINGHISITVALVSTMTLGIVVDDTVHFLSKYLHARRHLGQATQAAINYAYSTVGIALVMTTLVLVAGFGVMSLSPFEPSARMAELALLTISSALIFDLLFLPALIGTVDKDQREETAKPSESTRL